MCAAFNRGLSDHGFDRFKADFKFLFSRVIEGGHELDLRLRKDYFNIYCRGNSLAKVVVKPSCYEAHVHQEFAQGVTTTPTSISATCSDYIRRCGRRIWTGWRCPTVRQAR